MIHEISTAEFIAGIANDFYDENDIVKYCSTLGNIKAFWGALIVEHSKMIDKHNVAIVSFSEDGILHTDDSDHLTPETRLKIERISKAIFIVEDIIGQQEHAKGFQLTEHQKAMFEKAINAGYMEITENGYKWLCGGNKGKVRLAYFINKVFNPKETAQIPYKALEAMFNISRLDSAVQQAINGGKSIKAQQWRAEIDRLFNE